MVEQAARGQAGEAIGLPAPRKWGHVHSDGEYGQFSDRHHGPISAEEGLDYAMPKGQGHSHSMDRKRPVSAP